MVKSDSSVLALDGSFASFSECCLCKSETSEQCKTCKDKFCSLLCHDEYYWRTDGSCAHCAEMPKLIKLVDSETLTDSHSEGVPVPVVPVPALPRLKYHEIEMAAIENGDMVQITTVWNHQSVFIRSLKHEEDFIGTIEIVKESAKSAQPLMELPERNELVLAPYQNEYYRSLVLAVDEAENRSKLAFIDYGNTEWVHLSALKHLSDDLLQYRRHAVRVILKGVENEDAEAKMIYLKTLEYGVFKVKSENSIVVSKSIIELTDVSNQKLINESVASVHKIKFDEKMLVRRHLNVLNTRVVIIDSTMLLENKIIGCILKSDFNTYVGNLLYMKSFGNLLDSKPIYRARAKELCMVKLYKDGKHVWYRAIIIDYLLDGKYLVELIDIGRDTIIKSSDIREMNEDFMFDILTFKCLVDTTGNQFNLSPMTTAMAISILKKKIDDDLHVITFDWSSFNLRNQ